MENGYKYKVAVCPFCKQGWVEIVKEIYTNQLFLYCDECEIEWLSPGEFQNNIGATRNRFGKITEPTYDEICLKGWDKYIYNC